jgi:hypothetical protein
MSFEEKKAWIYGALAIILPALYAGVVFGQLSAVPVDHIEFGGPLLVAIVTAIGLTILGTILLSIFSGKSPDKPDERDRSIARRSDLVGYYVLSAGVVGTLILVVQHQPYFWIGNAIYGAFIVSAVVSSIVKIVSYRRGF